MKTIAIVTGASSGMGREAALQLAARFRRLDEIWLVARRKERLLTLKKPLARYGIKAVLLAGDLTDAQFLSGIEKRLSEERCGVIALVNASGFGKIGAVAALSEDVQADMVSLNCTALLRLCRMTLPYLLDGYSRILNFASAAAFAPQPDFAVYAATKAFVLHFSEALHEELKPRRIPVTAICPGPVRTAFFSIAEEFHAEPVYKRLFYANPKAVVRKALRDSQCGRPVSVYGISMRAFRILARLLPHAVIFSAMRLLNRTPEKTHAQP